DGAAARTVGAAAQAQPRRAGGFGAPVRARPSRQPRAERGAHAVRRPRRQPDQGDGRSRPGPGLRGRSPAPAAAAPRTYTRRPRLTLHSVQAGPATLGHPEQTERSGCMRILLVEDEAPLRETLAARLKREGFAVDAAQDGEEGLYMGREVPFDVGIIDLGLPKMSGMELIKALRDEGKQFPVLILTARSSWQDKVDG